MNQKQRRGLGRGLGALIPTAPEAEQETSEGDSASEVPAGATPAGQTTGGAAGASTADSVATEASSTDGANSTGGARQDERQPGGTGEAVSSTPVYSSVSLAQGDTPTGPSTVAGAYFDELPVEQITPNARQPREVFDEEAMTELVHSIREVGLLQPIVVRRTDDDAYELIMGERRWRAAQEAGLTQIPAIVRQTDDTDMLRDALLENLHRSQLNPLEEAAAYGQLLEDFGCTHDELAQRIGRSRPQISNTLRLMRLSPAVQRRVAAGVLSAGHARALLGVEDADIQDRLAQRVVSEGISVRGLEEIVTVGDHGGGRRGPARRKPTAPGLTDLAERLSDRLETRVKVDLGKTKGKITVEFASLEDLQRIVDIMDPRNRSDRPI